MRKKKRMKTKTMYTSINNRLRLFVRSGLDMVAVDVHVVVNEKCEQNEIKNKKNMYSNIPNKIMFIEY